MNSIRQHIPNFVSGFEPRENEFQTTAELLAIPWIARWAQEMDGMAFHRFSQNEDRLMAEFANGYHWWVVGFLKEPVDLPRWEAKRG